MGCFYTALAFGFSFMGFVLREPAVHLHEYSFPDFIVEIGGHFLFGVVAVLPFIVVSFELVILAGVLAVTIDIDHLLAALNLNVVSRPAHSFAFLILASLAFIYIARSLKLGSENRQLLAKQIGFIPAAAILSHISYDIFAAYGIFSAGESSFPLFVPFNFQLIPFPYWTWIVFEMMGFFVALAGLLITRATSQRDLELRRSEKEGGDIE